MFYNLFQKIYGVTEPGSMKFTDQQTYMRGIAMLQFQLNLDFIEDLNFKLKNDWQTWQI